MAETPSHEVVSLEPLNAPTWTAAWIGLDDTKPAALSWRPLEQAPAKTYLPVVQLRTDFTLFSAPAKAVLYVTALGQIEPRLNGASVSDDRFTPGWSDYKTRLYYRAYDVTGRVRVGANTLGALLADGWFRGNISNTGQNHYGKKTRARMELHLIGADDRVTVIGTGPDWKASTGPILEDDMQAGETYDARLATPGWDAPGFAATDWKPVSTGAELEPKIIEAHPAPPVRVTQELPALAITEPAPGVYIFDLGQNFAGWARLKIRESAGTVVTLRFGEMLNADGSLYTANLRSARATDTYVAAGSGVETWAPRFTYHGFRYVEVSGLSQRPAPETITGLVAHTDLPQTGDFTCSDPLINRIFQNALWGQRSNYFEVPTDCPQRDERLGWSGDTQVFSRTGLYNMGAAPFLAKWVRDGIDVQAADGRFQDTPPLANVGPWSPGWADAIVIVPYEIWRATGDLSVIRTAYAAMKKHLAYFESCSPGFIGPDTGFGDWLAVGATTPKTLISTAYFAHSADLTAQMAAAIGEQEDAARFAELFEHIKTAFQVRFVAADGTIGSGSQTSYLLALRFKLLTAPQYTVAAQRLGEVIETKPDQMCGFLGINLLLPVLGETGRGDLAYRLLEKRAYPSWGYSIDQGATTIWERWNSFTKDHGFGEVKMNSFNHYAYGACVEWLYSDILGIQPAAPGYDRIDLRARPGGGLTWAKGHYDCVHGRIAVEWSVAGFRFKETVTVPAGTIATLWMPAATASQVSVPKTPGVHFLRVEELPSNDEHAASAWCLFEIPPGTHDFECPARESF